MRVNYRKCLPVILAYEGGFSNHSRDPGGVTLEGIIQRVYDGFRARKGLPRRPLSAAMRGKPDWIAERDEIYRVQYWDAVRGDELPAGIDLIMFDGAVNSGPYQSVKWLQRALGVEADGHLGEATLTAAKNFPDHDALIAGICARRLGMLKSLSTWSDFGKGWQKRVANVKAIGQAWASGSVGPAPVAEGSGRAYASDVVQPMVDAGTATKGAVGGGSVAGLVSTAKDQLQPLVGASDFVDRIYLILIAAGVVIGLGAAGYALYADWRTKKAQRAIDGHVLAEVPEGQPA